MLHSPSNANYLLRSRFVTVIIISSTTLEKQSPEWDQGSLSRWNMYHWPAQGKREQSNMFYVQPYFSTVLVQMHSKSLLK